MLQASGQEANTSTWRKTTAAPDTEHNEGCRFWVAEGDAHRACFWTDVHNATEVVILGGVTGPGDGSFDLFICTFLYGLSISSLFTPLVFLLVAL